MMIASDANFCYGAVPIDNLSQVIKDRGTDEERTAGFGVVVELGDEFLRFLRERIRPKIIGGDSYTDAMEGYMFSIRGMFKPGWKHERRTRAVPAAR
jgi:hypothetical protein